MSKWASHHAPRAVVPPASVLQTRDVQDASTSLALSSPSSFGLGISRVSTVNAAANGPLPLYYVSPRAAADRSPAADARNPPGVQAGWYVVAEPGAQFELFLSPLRGTSSLERTTADGDMMIGKVFVDATVADACGHVFSRTDGSGSEVCYPGFVESSRMDPTTHERHMVYRKFEFCKAATLAGAGGTASTEGGTIRLSLETARRGPNAQPRTTGQLYDLNAGANVNEKDALKKGASIGVRRDGEMISRRCNVAKCTTHTRVPFLMGEVTIFMREKFWLVSRKIINEQGYPVKYEDISKPKLTIVEEVLSDDDVLHVPQAKRAKREPIKTQAKQGKFDPDEVIDLG